jgi:phosphatidylglycerophosphate synthase
VSGSIVTPELRARVRGLVQPIVGVFVRLGLTPNQLTLIGFGIAIVAAVAAAREAWVAAAALVLFGGVFDLFDGALARATNSVSRLGAFYDSVFDRWGEGVVYVGIAWGCVNAGFHEGAVLAIAALASSVMVSYARARSESLGFTPGTGMANVGLAPREVRIIILAVGLLLTGLAGGLAASVAGCPTGSTCYDVAVVGTAGDSVLAVTLGLIAILATITTIQRILHVRAQAREG